MSRQKGFKHSEETKGKMSRSRRGFKMSKEQKDKLSLSHTGKVLSETHKNEIGKSMVGITNIGQFKKGSGGFTGRHSEQTKTLLSSQRLGKKLGDRFTPQGRKRLKELRKGKKSVWWRGGISEANKIARKSSEMRQARKKCFQRDNWTCQSCGVRGGELHPHHIKPFAIFPDLRFSVENLTTLCASCHKKTDSYAKRLS